MALISCPDCSNEVSDAAPACPKCGRPIAAQPVNVTKGVGVKEGVKIGAGMFIILPILLLFGSCAACVSCLGVSASHYDQVRREHQQRMQP